MGLVPELDTEAYVGAFNFRVSIPDVAGDVNQSFTRVSGVVSTSEPMEAGSIIRRDVKIEMMKGNGEVSRTMMCMGAWPSRWELPEMDASGSGGAVERISLTVERVTNE